MAFPCIVYRVRGENKHRYETDLQDRGIYPGQCFPGELRTRTKSRCRPSSSSFLKIFIYSAESGLIPGTRDLSLGCTDSPVVAQGLGSCVWALLSLTCGILVLRPGIEPVPTAGRARASNHWTAGEFLHIFCFK